MKDGPITAGDWLRSLGPGLLAGAVLVAVAMLLEDETIKVGSKLFKK